MKSPISQQNTGKKLLFAAAAIIASAVLMFAVLIPLSSIYYVPVLEHFVPPISIALSAGLFALYRFLAKRLELEQGVLFRIPPKWAISKTLALFFVLASCLYAAAVLLGKLQFTGFDAKSYYNAIQAATLEEIFFRLFMLHTLISIFAWSKRIWSLVFISSIFGLIHMANYFIGNSSALDVSYILGMTAGGMLLGSFYIRFGLISAMLLHWLWNSQMGLSLSNGKSLTQFAESSNLVSIILIVISLAVEFVPSKQNLAQSVVAGS